MAVKSCEECGAPFWIGGMRLAIDRAWWILRHPRSTKRKPVINSDWLMAEWFHRQHRDNELIAKLAEIRKHYEGNLIVPLPEVNDD